MERAIQLDPDRVPSNLGEASDLFLHAMPPLIQASFARLKESELSQVTDADGGKLLVDSWSLDEPDTRLARWFNRVHGTTTPQEIAYLIVVESWRTLKEEASATEG